MRDWADEQAAKIAGAAATMEHRDAIAAALRAERERCARLAEFKYAGRGWYPAARNAGNAIAGDIRRGKPPTDATVIRAGVADGGGKREDGSQ